MASDTTSRSDTFDIGGDLTVNRLGFGAMRITGEDIIGRPDDEVDAKAVLQRAVELGVDFVDTADSYGPGVSERLIGRRSATPTTWSSPRRPACSATVRASGSPRRPGLPAESGAV